MDDKMIEKELSETCPASSSKGVPETDSKFASTSCQNNEPEQSDSDSEELDLNNNEKSMTLLLPPPPPVPVNDRKRQREGETIRERRFKSQKIAKTLKKSSSIEKITIIPKKLNLTDLNIDCLEQIFKKLDFVDLVNVATSDESFVQAAQLSFSRRYSNHLYKISGIESAHPILEQDLTIVISSVFECLNILRIFGAFIKNVQFQYFMTVSNTDWVEVKDLFHKKYASQLIELKLINCSKEMFIGAVNVFENVKNLRISCSQLGKCVFLNKWFPKLEHLELMHNDGCLQIESYFPHLSFLAMDTDAACTTTADLKRMIKSAPNLKTLSLSGGVDLDFLRFISKTLKYLQQLNLWDFHLDTDDLEDVEFSTVETLFISTGMLGFLPQEIPFGFKNLKKLYILSDSIGLDWIQFALAHENLVSLRLDSYYDPENFYEELHEIATKLTILKELDLFLEISVEGLVQLLDNSKSLQKIRIRGAAEITLDELNTMAGTEWNVTKNSRQMILERKVTDTK